MTVVMNHGNRKRIHITENVNFHEARLDHDSWRPFFGDARAILDRYTGSGLHTPRAVDMNDLHMVSRAGRRNAQKAATIFINEDSAL
jgi:hypothetical protein